MGTLLRQLVTLMDGEVDAFYVREGLPLRSRYTPVIKALLRRDSATIKQLAADVGLTHSALSQTISQMTKEGLVIGRPGDDPRERHIRLTPAAKALLPRIKECWRLFDAAAASVSSDAGASLAAVCASAIAALEAKPFGERIKAAGQPKKARSSRSKQKP